MGKTSDVWKLFKKVDTTWAVCQICKLRYKRSGNTSNLKDHLKRKHMPEWRYLNSTDIEQDINGNENNEVLDDGVPAKIPRSRITLKRMLERSQNQNYAEESSKKVSLDRFYIRMLAIDLEPLRKGEHEGFKKFVNALDSKYVITSIYTVKNKLLLAEYQIIKDKFERELTSTSACSITTDMWTSSANEGILTVTCHYVGTENYILRSAVLESVKLDGRHTADNIACVLDTILRRWSIRDKVVAMVTDNAGNMVNAASLLKIRQAPCFAHTLNLVVTDTYQMEWFSELLKECKNIASHFRSSSLSSETLRKIQRENGKPELKLIQEVSTRWNSTYAMIKRLIEIRTELILAINLCPKAPHPLLAEEYSILEEIVCLLEPFEIATKEISGDKYVTISLIIPLIRGIMDRLDKIDNITTSEGASFLEKLKDSVRLRLKPYENRTPVILGAILDPRIKKRAFRTDEDGNNAAQILIRELTVLIKSEVREVTFKWKRKLTRDVNPPK
ncbi:hypothetical protein JTB14_014615 [Gonioctena quinquepunctata]|nr:hypothetical protein JTB14_014615 [Gonioctena quinquepunctata]